MRLDKFLVEHGHFSSREKAQEEIKNASIQIDGKIVTKSSFEVGEQNQVEIVANFCPYVSRAGLKIEKAKQVFGLDFENKIVLDIGASTGGFTDFCLKSGAKKVFAVDVGSNQLHSSLRNDDKVVCLENTDIRVLQLEEKIDIAVCDVSFISLTKIGDAVCRLLDGGKHFVALIKPQFECGKDVARKHKGVIKSDKVHNECITRVVDFYVSLGFELKGIGPSPIKGGDGNCEFLSYFVKK